MSKKIIAYWKSQNKYEVYSSLTGFVESNPQYNRSTLTYWITRKGVPFQDMSVMVLRVDYIARAKK